MAKQARERNKEFHTPTARVGTLVDLFLVSGRVEMLVQARFGTKLGMTEVALPAIAIVGLTSGLVAKMLLVAPRNLSVGNESVCIALPNGPEEGLSVEG